MRKFRFQDLKIWQEAIQITDKLLDISDALEERRAYKFAEQLRGASLSMTNNIAEGSGSSSDRDFANFLNIARRSTFENANMLIIFHRRKLINETTKTELFNSLDELCRKMTNFQKTLLKV